MHKINTSSTLAFLTLVTVLLHTYGYHNHISQGCNNFCIITDIIIVTGRHGTTILASYKLLHGRNYIIIKGYKNV